MNFRKFMPFHRELGWQVKTADTYHDLTFETRQEARQYKKLLISSKSKLSAKIVLHEFFDGHLVDKEVS